MIVETKGQTLYSLEVPLIKQTTQEMVFHFLCAIA